MRLDRVVARRAGRPPYDWRSWAARLLAETPPGMARLALLSKIFPVPLDLDNDPEYFVARIEDLLLEAAADGAVLVEVRCGNETILRPRFMELIREAEGRVQHRYPALRAVPVAILLLWLPPERLALLVAAARLAARDGLGGVDLLYRPYDTEASWDVANQVAERLADAGLGITAHAGEFSTANLAAALRVPGLTRIGHATRATDDPALLDLLVRSGVAVECCLSCNVILGAVASYEEHPIRRFIASGIPVVLGTDDPVQICTTIGREYALAAALGFSPDDLLGITRTAIIRSFATAEQKAALLAHIDRAASQLARE